MTNQIHHGESVPLPPGVGRHAAARLDGLYAEVCKPESLARACAELKKEGFPDIPVKALEELQHQLETRNFAALEAPGEGAGPNAEPAAGGALPAVLLGTAIKIVLERYFPGEPPCDPGPEAFARWLRAGSDGGLTRVVVVAFDEKRAEASACILAQAARHIRDADFLALLEQVLRQGGAAPPEEAAGSASTRLRSLRAFLRDRLVFQGVDAVLEQAKALGRPGAFTHATAARFGPSTVILVKDEPQYDWFVPAVRKRLEEEGAALQVEIDPAKTQRAALERGEKLCFLGHEFRRVQGQGAGARVEYRVLAPVPPPARAKQTGPLRRWLGPWWPGRQRPARARRNEGGPRPRELERADDGVEGSVLEGLAGLQQRAATLGNGLAAGGARFARYLGRRWKFVGALACGVGLAAALLLYVRGPASTGERLALYPVQGKVFLEGAPAVGALVVFHTRAEGSKPLASAKVAADGSYVVGTYAPQDGAPLGAYAVTVTMHQSRLATRPPEELQIAKGFPGRYAEPATTPLAVTVEATANEVPPFELTRKRPAAKKGGSDARTPSK